MYEIAVYFLHVKRPSTYSKSINGCIWKVSFDYIAYSSKAPRLRKIKIY